MAGLNKVMVIGNLGRDPEMRYTPNGKPVTSFSVAVSRRFTPESGESREETIWFRISAWNTLAERCNQYLAKGRRVFVEGRISPPRIWTGNDGQPRAELEITASDVVFLDSRGVEGGDEMAPVGGGRSMGGRGGDDLDPDDLPF